MARLRTRVNDDGYHEFWDNTEERWVRAHRRAAENKLGRPLGRGEVVHHIDEDKSNNRYENLAVTTRRIHGHIHAGNPDVCFKCGRSGHWSSDCYARTDYGGERVRQQRRRRSRW